MWKRRQPEINKQAKARLLSGILTVHQNAVFVLQECRYAGRVQDFDAHTISLTAPIDRNGVPMFLEAGTDLEIVLEAVGGFYGFSSVVVASRLVDGAPLVICVRPLSAQRTDRRGYYRVPVNIPLRYSSGEGETLHSGRMIDISGGGVLCLIHPNYAIHQGDHMHLTFTLPGQGSSMALHSIARLVNPEVTGIWRRVACEFLQVEELTRDRILQYVTQRQLELIRAGLMR